MFIQIFVVSVTEISEEEHEIIYNNMVDQIQEGDRETYGNNFVIIMYDESS